MKIPGSEIEYSRLSLVDVGRVFWWRNRLFRAFPASAVPAVKRMFDSGLILTLVDQRLLVGSWITSYQVDDYDLVIEHEVVDVPIYPREWSFSMLRDAALLVLALNDTSRAFGYQTKDCNGYNVLFNSGKPVFVDLGSFVEVESRDDVLLSYEEFLLSYYYPLQIWRSAGQYLGERVTPRAAGKLLAHEAYVRYRWPFLRRLNDARLVQFSKSLNSLRTLQHNDFSKLRKHLTPWLVWVLGRLKAAKIFEGPARIGCLERKTRKMEHSTGATIWANYHDKFSRGQSPKLTSRFETVLDKVRQLGAGSVLEIGGNQGILSRVLKQRSPQVRVVCTDPDGIAIDKGYRASITSNEGVEWAIFNPFAYESSPAEVPPEQRFQAEAVIVLALTHHLTLSHNLRLAYVFDVIGQYSTRYVFIEFMPLGLHDGSSAPDIPSWYNETWFNAEFCKKFELLDRIELEPNRVLYVGATGPRQDLRLWREVPDDSASQPVKGH